MRWPYPRTPSLGGGLPSLYAAGTKVFDERVKSQFPIGMSESDLIAQLRKQGFRIHCTPPNVDHNSAAIEQGFIFRTIWSVCWRAKAGKLEEIWGVYGVIAP